MSVLDLARVIIYRFHEKGLEIFLINNEMDKDQDIWQIPQGLSESIREKGHLKNIIDLDTMVDENVRTVKTLGIEGEWHDIQSIRGM